MISFRPGVLSRNQLIRLAEAEVIAGSAMPESAAGQSSFDLTLSNVGWIMRGSIKGGADHRYSDVLDDPTHIIGMLSLASPVILEPLQTYIVKLVERLDLTAVPDLYGFASGKSSVGRLDVLVRLVADYSSAFDRVNAATESGQTAIELYAEITPISFPIVVQAGCSLNQLRFIQGAPDVSELPPAALRCYPGILLDSSGQPLESERIDRLTVDLTPVEGIGSEGLVGYEALGTFDEPIELTSGVGRYQPERYWREVINPHSRAIRITPERFYILRSRERFKLPGDVAVYVYAMTESMGELRIHYAGFIHPGFGFDRENGTPLIFEIRGHNVTTFLRDGEPIALIRYYRMSEPIESTAIVSGGYGQQELTLSRYFAKWGTNC